MNEITAVEPGDILSFNLSGKRVSGRAWPTISGLVVEVSRGAVELGAIDPVRDGLTIKKAAKRRKNARRLPIAQEISDFRPNLDRVIRVGLRHFAVSADETFAAVEVDEVPLSVFVANHPATTAKGWDETRCFAAVQAAPFLSAEGRKERLDFLLLTGKVRLSFTVAA